MTWTQETYESEVDPEIAGERIRELYVRTLPWNSRKASCFRNKDLSQFLRHVAKRISVDSRAGSIFDVLDAALPNGFPSSKVTKNSKGKRMKLEIFYPHFPSYVLTPILSSCFREEGELWRGFNLQLRSWPSKVAGGKKKPFCSHNRSNEQAENIIGGGP